MTATKLATLTTNSNLQPVLVLDPGSHLLIGKIVSALKEMKTGLWPRHEGGTTIVITPSKGKEDQLYKLAWSLPSRGYKLEETPAHKGLDEARAERDEARAKRKAEIEQRVAQAAIPPRGFVQKRFKWSRHRNFIVARFAQKSAFLAWAKAQNIQPTWTGEHRAIIPLAHLPWLQASGIIPQFRALPPASPEPVADPEPKPNSSWTRDQLKKWCEARGLSTLGLNRKAELLELIQEVQH